MFETRKELIAYLAGFLDGEGCFIILFDSNGVFSARINAGQANPLPLELLKETFGGIILQNKRSYSSKFSNVLLYQWTIYGAVMYKALLELRPYLLLKGEQADCLIQLYESIQKYKGRVGRNREFPFLPKEVMLERAILYNTCKELKHGPAATTKREGVDVGQPCDSLNCKDGKLAEAAEMPAHLGTEKELRS